MLRSALCEKVTMHSVFISAPRTTHDTIVSLVPDLKENIFQQFVKRREFIGAINRDKGQLTDPSNGLVTRLCGGWFWAPPSDSS